MKTLPLSDEVRSRYRAWRRDVDQGDYRPALNVRSFNSAGTASLIWSSKTGRTHHLMSQGELHAFLYWESRPTVLDIREQYALDPELTLRLAEPLAIRHPGSPRLGSITPITTDLLVKVRLKGRIGWFAMAYKPTNIRATPNPKGRLLRAVNSLKLEEAYWGYRQVPWRLSVAADYDRREVYNLEFVRPERLLVDEERSYLEPFRTRFERYWQWHPEKCLASLIEATASLIGIECADSHSLFKWLAWHHSFSIDFKQPVELYLPLPRLKGVGR